MSKKHVIILVVIGLIAFQGFRIFRDSGAFVEVQPVAYGTCKKMHGPPGSEDINIDPANQIAFISSGNGREVFASYRNGNQAAVPDGDIWLLDLSSKDSEPVRSQVKIDGYFRPHGIDLLTLANGDRELYIVNHPARDQHEVLIFMVSATNDLTLKRRIRYPELISPNDIEAIDSGRFFVTNDHGSPQSSFMARVEEYLGLSRSSVSYFDGKKGSLLLEGVKSANGITLSEDQQTLYVAEALGRSVKKYKRGDSIRDWQFVDMIAVNTAVDNLEWGENGKLLAGAHPRIFDLLGHIGDANEISPSHVISIDTGQSPMTSETIYMNDGSELSGSSVATTLNGEMLIGAILETHFLRCSKTGLP